MTKRSHEDEKLPTKGHKDSDERENEYGAKKLAFQSDQHITEKKSHIGDKDKENGAGGTSVKSGHQGKDGESDNWEGKGGQPAVELDQHLKAHQDINAQGSQGGNGGKGGTRGTSVKSGHDGEDGGSDSRGGKGGQPAVELDQDQGGRQVEVTLKPQGSRGGKGGQGGKGGICAKSGNAGEDGRSDGQGGKGGQPAVELNQHLKTQGSRDGKGGQGGKKGFFAKGGKAGEDGSSDGRGGKGGSPDFSSRKDLQNDKNGKARSCILS